MAPGLLLRWMARFLGIISISSALVSFGSTARHKQTLKVATVTMGPFGNLLVPHTLWFPPCFNPLPAVYVDPVSPSGATPGLVHQPGGAVSQVLPSTKVPGQVQPHGGNWVTCTIYAGAQGKRVICTLYADTRVFGGNWVTCTIYAGTQGKWVICTLHADTQVSLGGRRSFAAGFHGSSGSLARCGSSGSSARHGSSGPSARHASFGSLARHGSSGSSVRHGPSGVPGSLVLFSVTVLHPHSGGCLLPTRWSFHPGYGQALPDPWPAAPGPRQATPGPGQATPGSRPVIPGPGQATTGSGRARLTVTHDINIILSYVSLLLSLALNVMTWNLLAHATVWACGSPGRGRYNATVHTQSPHQHCITASLLKLAVTAETCIRRYR